MRYFVQFHNANKLGWVPLDERPFFNERPCIYTRRAEVAKVVGARVFLIVGLGEPRQYYLWETFQIEKVEQRDGAYYADGPGWQLMPPQHLSGPAFDTFRQACANFFGFRSIDEQPYHLVLDDLASRFRRENVDEYTLRFCKTLQDAFPTSGDPW